MSQAPLSLGSGVALSRLPVALQLKEMTICDTLGFPARIKGVGLLSLMEAAAMKNVARISFALLLLCSPLFLLSCSPLSAGGDLGGVPDNAKSPAEQGDADAQYELGQAYYFGKGVTKDDWKAVKWYRKAAKQGHADAQFKLGYMHSLREGVPREDFKAAVKWYRKAAEQGNAKAQHSLGTMYDMGFGVRSDRNEALRLYEMAEEGLRIAAEQGDADAQYLWGDAHWWGTGALEDEEEAAKWHRKAAEQGHVNSQYALAIMYYKGEGVPQDLGEASKWCRMAADRGNPDAKAQVRDGIWCGKDDHGDGREPSNAR